MAPNTHDPSETGTEPMVLTLGGRSIQVAAPTGPVGMIDLLPVIRTLTDAVVDAAVEAHNKQGAAVTCEQGCTSCCYHLVPVASFEARFLRDIVLEMPEPRRTAVRERFADARRRLLEAGRLESLLDTDAMGGVDFADLGPRYHRLWIPCPFLEEQMCSIYPFRPTVCRQHLVTSPPQNCDIMSREAVTKVKLMGSVFLSALSVAGEIRDGRAQWVPLVVAPEWADSHPDQSALRPGADLVRELQETLEGKRPVA